MMDLERLLSCMDGPLAPWRDILPTQIQARFQQRLHGDMPRWQAALDRLPELPAEDMDLGAGAVRVGSADSADDATRAVMREALMELHPWRKGPFRIHGLHIDTEWRSDWKWARLQPHIRPLAGRRVLDVGCGNGYYGWRMLGEGAELVIGIDPTQLFLMQFRALEHFMGRGRFPLFQLPLGMEDVPPDLQSFDTVFSMGVFYHRRSPMDHLFELRGCLRPGGELVLETLVIEGREGEVLVPPGRYAKMRNVWFIPTPDTLLGWLRRCGFRNPRVVDVTPTRVEEQRATGWMQFESLADYLDTGDPGLTVEGHPAPVRALFIAEAP